MKTPKAEFSALCLPATREKEVPNALVGGRHENDSAERFAGRSRMRHLALNEPELKVAGNRNTRGLLEWRHPTDPRLTLRRCWRDSGGNKCNKTATLRWFPNARLRETIRGPSGPALTKAIDSLREEMKKQMDSLEVFNREEY